MKNTFTNIPKPPLQVIKRVTYYIPLMPKMCIDKPHHPKDNAKMRTTKSSRGRQPTQPPPKHISAINSYIYCIHKLRAIAFSITANDLNSLFAFGLLFGVSFDGCLSKSYRFNTLPRDWPYVPSFHKHISLMCIQKGRRINETKTPEGRLAAQIDHVSRVAITFTDNPKYIYIYIYGMERALMATSWGACQRLGRLRASHYSPKNSREEGGDRTRSTSTIIGCDTWEFMDGTRRWCGKLKAKLKEAKCEQWKTLFC